MDPGQWNHGCSSSYHKYTSGEGLPPKPVGRYEFPILDNVSSLEGLSGFPGTLTSPSGFPVLPGHYRHPLSSNLPPLTDTADSYQTAMGAHYHIGSDPKYLPKHQAVETENLNHESASFVDKAVEDQGWGLSSFITPNVTSYSGISLDRGSNVSQTPLSAHIGSKSSIKQYSCVAVTSHHIFNNVTQAPHNISSNVSQTSVLAPHDVHHQSVILHKQLPNSHLQFSEPHKSSFVDVLPSQHHHSLGSRQDLTQETRRLYDTPRQNYVNTSHYETSNKLPEYTASQASKELNRVQHSQSNQDVVSSYYQPEVDNKALTVSSGYIPPPSFSNNAHYDPISPAMPDDIKDDHEVCNSNSQTGSFQCGDYTRSKPEAYNLDQFLIHDKTPERSLPVILPLGQYPFTLSTSSSAMVQRTSQQISATSSFETPTPNIAIQAVADSTTKKGQKPKRSRKKKEQIQLESLKSDSNAVTSDSYLFTVPVMPSKIDSGVILYNSKMPKADMNIKINNMQGSHEQSHITSPVPDLKQVSHLIMVSPGAHVLPDMNLGMNTLGTMPTSNSIVPVFQEPLVTDTQVSMPQTKVVASRNVSIPVLTQTTDILAQSVNAAGLSEGIDVFAANPFILDQSEINSKTYQKRNIRVVSDVDDEFDHLASPSKNLLKSSDLEQSTSKPVSKPAGFQNSFLNFIHGGKQETLSEVTQMPAVNKPQLPKYMPEDRPRRPVQQHTQSVSSETSDDYSDSDSSCNEINNSTLRTVQHDPGSPPVQTVKIDLRNLKSKSGRRTAIKSKNKVQSSLEERVKGTDNSDDEVGEFYVERESTPPRRVQSARKAKECAKRIKLRKDDSCDDEVVTLSSCDEKGYDSDKDPAWNPFRDAYEGEDGANKKTRKRGITTTRSGRWRISKNIRDPGQEDIKRQTENFFIDTRKELDANTYCIWRKDSGKLIQKYEVHFIGDKQYHKASSTYSSIEEGVKEMYKPISVTFADGNSDLVEVLPQNKPKQMNVLLEELAEPFKVYMQIMLSQVLAPGFLKAVEEEKDDFYLGPLNNVDIILKSKQEEMESFLQWKALFWKTVKLRPHLNVSSQSECSQLCQASLSSSASASTSVQLYGDEYDKTTLETTPNSTTQEFSISEMAAQHLETYHALCHFKMHLFQRCVAKVDILKDGEQCLENIEILDSCLQNKNWILQILSDLGKLLQYKCKPA